MAALSFSLSGLNSAFREEIAFRQILCCLAVAIPLALWLAESWAEVVLLILPPSICVIVELINTAIENVVDLAQPGWHELAKKAKDTASAAQFCSQLLAAGVWASWLAGKLF